MRFVAARTTTPFNVWIPSSSVRSERSCLAAECRAVCRIFPHARGPGRPYPCGLSPQGQRHRSMSGFHRAQSDLSVLVWRRNVEQFVESSRTQEGRVDHIHAVCRRKDNDTVQCLDSIELSQKLADNTLSNHAVASQTSHWSECINFVEKDHTGRCLTSSPEYFTNSSLRFSDPL